MSAHNIMDQIRQASEIGLVTTTNPMHLGDNAPTGYGNDNDLLTYWDGTDFVILPKTDNTGTYTWGDGTTDMDLKIYMGSTALTILFDNSEAEVIYADSVSHIFGTGSDAEFVFDGTIMSVLAGTDNLKFKFGDGTKSWDIWTYGNIPTSYMLWDASADTLSLEGAARTSKMNTISPRFELKWVAGARGRIGLNADMTPGSADDGNDGATKTEIDLMNATDPDFELLGNSHDSGDVTAETGGGLKFETDGGGTDRLVMLPHLATDQSPWTKVVWATSKEVIWEAHLKSGSNIGDQVLYAGLKLTNVSGASVDNDAVWFRYENGVNSEKWQAKSAISTTDVDTDTGVTIGTSTEYHFKIVIASNRTAQMYLNGVLVFTTAALTSGNLIPYIGIEETTTSAKHMIVYGQAISRAY